MYKLELNSYAKINLTLDVLGKEDNNKFNFKMIMQKVNFADEIVIRKMKAEGIKLNTNLPWVPTDSKNLVYKVVQKIKEKFNITEGVFIDINKKIPVAAGLGGGSANAATAIIGMNELFDLKMTTEELIELGRQFDSDIPYCIMDGTCLVEGNGEKITELKDIPQCYVVLCKPDVIVSTKEVHKNFEPSLIKKHPDTEGMIEAINDGDLKRIGDLLLNTMEGYTASICPEIKEIKKDMMQGGALGASMSGSGATVFGLFDDYSKAQKVKDYLKYQKYIRETYLVNTL